MVVVDEPKTTPAQRRANKKWKEKNKKKNRIYVAKSTAKRYITDIINDEEEIEEVEEWIEIAKNKLK